MVRVTNPSHVKAARLRESGIEWSIALVKAKVPGTDLTRKSVRRIIRELVTTAKADFDSFDQFECYSKCRHRMRHQKLPRKHPSFVSNSSHGHELQSLAIVHIVHYDSTAP